MKRWIILSAVLTVLYACQENDTVSDFTGNEITYALQQGSAFAVNGTITFKERTDGRVSALVDLSGTDGDQKLPVHLHLGDVGEPDAEIALLLTPVQSGTGKSETIISQLANEEKVSYQQILNMNASIKIHLGESGPERDIILAAGNIGKAASQTNPSGRSSIAVCKSE